MKKKKLGRDPLTEKPLSFIKDTRDKGIKERRNNGVTELRKDVIEEESKKMTVQLPINLYRAWKNYEYEQLSKYNNNISFQSFIRELLKDKLKKYIK